MSDKLVSRVMPGINDLALAMVRFRVSQLEKLCESPIEIMLGAALLIADQLEPFGADRLCIAKPTEDWPDHARLLIPQFQIDEYRADFAYRLDSRVTLIECDGHDFHERTKAQAAHDKQRDRFLQFRGYPVLRFTGSEIFADPVGCATEVSEFVWNREVEQQLA